MSRRDAREKAFMLLYQLEIQRGDEEAQMASFIEEREVEASEVEYLTSLVKGVREKQNDLDSRFTPFLKRWSKDRLPKVDLTILRLAVFEIVYVPDVPNSVAISEAVLLCKKYSSEESRSYINGVLGRLCKGLSEGLSESSPESSDSRNESNDSRNESSDSRNDLSESSNKLSAESSKGLSE